MIAALLFLILFALLFPKALRFLFALLLLGGIMILGGAHAAGANDDLPIKDVESDCRTADSYYRGKSSYDGCMDQAQAAYDYDKLMWSQTSLVDREACLSYTEDNSPNGVSYYLYMQGCLEVKAAEYEARRPRQFNPW
jgi:hypothetical protein